MSVKFPCVEQDGEDDLMTAALYVGDIKDDEDDDGKPPEDGMAFLRQVVKERKRIPEVVSTDINTDKIATIKANVETKPTEEESPAQLLGRLKAAAPPGCCPGVVWQREQVKQFSEVRSNLARHIKLIKFEEKEKQKIPDKKNEALWCHLMLGGEVWNMVVKSRKEEGRVEEIAEGKKDVTGEPPKLGFVTGIPVYVCEQVLEYMVSWLTVTGWRKEFGPWVYSLLVRLEKPLSPDVGSLLRDLALLCAQQRLEMYKKVELKDDKEEVPDENIAAFNLFICLVAKYFDQGDLVDNED